MLYRSKAPHRLPGVNFLPDSKPQSEKFKELARELRADEDEARWDERLKKVAKGKSDEKPQ
jgi:hypothetical protein